ncbi:GNAT family N-acetyltransferase [Undibacterium sp.]|uniref:GNAT family N-acetyltransferase n=1 Tax=Undibacterium sp. TaxID=1914977 RepID=UPI003753D0A4
MSYQPSNFNYTHQPYNLGKKTPHPFSAIALPSLGLNQYQLRPILARDLAAWYSYLIEPKVMEHSSWVLKSPQDLQQFIQVQDWSEAQAQVKFAITNDQDQLIGSIGFHTISISNLSVEIAYDLSPAYWGKGIVSAACRSLTKWAHQELGFVRVQACVVDSNLRSRQVLERCDFQLEGLLKSYKQIRNQSRDYWILSHIQS